MPWLAGIRGGFVEFNDVGRDDALVRGRITPDEVGWACAMLSRLSDRQWHDAFRGGGYSSERSNEFIATLRARLAEGMKVGGDDWP
jgi:hypothetical protein